MIIRAAFVSIVDDLVDDNDINKITSYCNYCESLGFYHKLGPRIYPKDQPLPYDHDLFLQCYNCGRIENRVHAKQLNEIVPIVEPSKNIHDSGKVIALATKGDSSHKRSKAMIDQIKKSRPGYNNRTNSEEQYDDLKRLLSQGKQLLSYTTEGQVNKDNK